MNILKPIEEFYSFLKYPFRQEFPTKVEFPFQYIHILWLAAFIFNIFSMGLVSSLIQIENMDNVFDDFGDMGALAMIGLAVILAPLLEELIFRFPLRNKITLTFLLIGLDAIVFSVVLKGVGLHELAIYLPIIVGLVGLLLIYFFESVRISWFEAIDNFYPFLFYFVAAMFAFIHIYNFSSDAFEWWMTPLMVIPQFVLGLCLGFTRLRIGIWASIYMHALNNAIPVFFLLLAKQIAQ